MPDSPSRVIAATSQPERTKYRRSIPPRHYLWEINSFDEVKKLDKCKSGVFEAADCKWSLILYPRGDRANDGSGHISLYLSFETANSTSNQKVEIDYRLFVHDKNDNTYLTIQDADGLLKRVDRRQTRWGFARFLSLETFENRQYGFLKNGSCTFGAEVLMEQDTRKVESLTLIPKPCITWKKKSVDDTFTWRLEGFSKMRRDSTTFVVGGRKWELKVAKNGESLSVDLTLLELSEKRKLYADFRLLVLDRQKETVEEKRSSRWINASDRTWKYPALVPLKDLQRRKDEGTPRIQVQFLVISIAKDISAKDKHRRR